MTDATSGLVRLEPGDIKSLVIAAEAEETTRYALQGITVDSLGQCFASDGRMLFVVKTKNHEIAKDSPTVFFPSHFLKRVLTVFGRRKYAISLCASWFIAAATGVRFAVKWLALSHREYFKKRDGKDWKLKHYTETIEQQAEANTHLCTPPDFWKAVPHWKKTTHRVALKLELLEKIVGIAKAQQSYSVEFAFDPDGWNSDTFDSINFNPIVFRCQNFFASRREPEHEVAFGVVMPMREDCRDECATRNHIEREMRSKP